MIDRELLTLAAKAAGYELKWTDDPEDHPRIFRDGAWWIWNPRDYKADSFELIAKLRMNVYYDTYVVDVAKGDIAVTEPYGADDDVTTRLAITRAAAEIGKTMQDKL